MVIHENYLIRDMPAPAISIVIPLYNMQREILQTLRSVLFQTFQNFEIIVVNDGSTDHGPELVTSLGDIRIQLVHQGRSGVSAARNKGITLSQADTIAFLDADDEWKPDFLETILRLKRNYPDCDVFATNYVYCYDRTNYVSTKIHGIPDQPWEGILENYFEVAANSNPPLWTSAVAVSKKAIASINGFPNCVATGEDLLTWAKLAVNYQIALSSHPQAVFHKGHHDSVIHGRCPDPEDYVGNQLHYLLEDKEIPGLRQYIALWHKMRASIYLQLGQPRKAKNELASSKRYGKDDMRTIAYRLISILPGWAAKKAFIALQSLVSKLSYKNERKAIK